MLHRALQQFLSDVFWGDLDVLLLDLPPGTGDIAISTAQLLPTAELLVVTTPQLAAAEVAERAGAIALQTQQQVVGVVENMSWHGRCPTARGSSCSAPAAAQVVADSLGRTLGADGAAARPDPARHRPAGGRRLRRSGGDLARPTPPQRWHCVRWPGRWARGHAASPAARWG